MPTVERVNNISFFDIDFEGDILSDAQLCFLRQWSDRESPNMGQFCCSFRWVFDWADGEETCLRGMERMDLSQMFMSSELIASLLVSCEYAVGVLCIWEATPHGADPLDLKTKAWDNHYLAYEKFKSTLEDTIAASGSGVLIRRSERRYPLTGVKITEPVADIMDCREKRVKLGRWLTGNYEGQKEAALLAAIEGQNLSDRMYEMLFIRWTDALAVYDGGVGDNYETALLRSALVYECAIILRRSLCSLADRMDVTTASLRAYLPNPWIVNRRLESLGRIRTSFVTLPPVQSIEAQHLLKAAYNSFGIPALINHSMEKARILESRWQWTKTQFMVAVGLVTYIMDKVGIFELLKGLFRS
ncbi:hypothetical protein KOM00_19460 [Geomonas sp. Red69]|uniref:hypothetical protein n=1 Tax=Geomonas diazotrophica TaxID=2843197 RepID=UPI001C0FCC83|nr:hypothetical protein [Geomonas diazotrophica]MBU5638903.1 hypothetical protein [Geomonas diazotrophica]